MYECYVVVNIANGPIKACAKKEANFKCNEKKRQNDSYFCASAAEDQNMMLWILDYCVDNKSFAQAMKFWWARDNEI